MAVGAPASSDGKRPGHLRWEAGAPSWVPAGAGLPGDPFPAIAVRGGLMPHVPSGKRGLRARNRRRPARRARSPRPTQEAWASTNPLWPSHALMSGRNGAASSHEGNVSGFATEQKATPREKSATCSTPSSARAMAKAMPCSARWRSATDCPSPNAVEGQSWNSGESCLSQTCRVNPAPVSSPIRRWDHAALTALKSAPPATRRCRISVARRNRASNMPLRSTARAKAFRPWQIKLAEPFAGRSSISAGMVIWDQGGWANRRPPHHGWDRATAFPSCPRTCGSPAERKVVSPRRRSAEAPPSRPAGSLRV